MPGVDPSDDSTRGGMALLASGSKLFYAAAASGLTSFAVALLGIAGYRLVIAASRDWNILHQTLECIGLVTIAIAVFEVGKFMVEEELVRERQLRSVLEARRSLTKFLTIVIITLSLEGLVLVFETKLEHVADLIYPTALLTVAVLAVVGHGPVPAADQRKRGQPDRGGPPGPGAQPGNSA